MSDRPQARPLTATDVETLRERLAGGGVAVFPTDTVYGLGCDPGDEAAVRRLYELKGRPPAQPSAVMLFSLTAALDALPELGERERSALEALLPGPLSVLLPNPNHRFPLAGGGDTLGLRVPRLPKRLAALATLDRPLLQSSANLSGGPDPRSLADVPDSIRAGADLVLDGGDLPGVASTVLDLRDHERTGQWRILRAGPLGEDEIERLLA